ncbi:AMP-binding protein [Brevibacterium album]|uniref:AMP-binding protein n=1 Tax=Brevibacterium album TaxID=417948 RepID=UPI00041BA342|nr:AMP-binding protein [Brevibacterium album]
MTTTRTLYGHLRDWAADSPDRVLVTQLDPEAADPAPVTARALLTRASALAVWLRRHGVGEGDCVAVWLPAWAESYAWQFAASAVGAHVIGVNTRYNVAEIGHVLLKARPAVLVAAHGFQRVDFLHTLRRVAENLPHGFRPPRVVVTPAPAAESEPNLRAWDLGAGSANAAAIAAPRPEAVPALRTDGDGALLAVAFTTSGSTGMPKLAAHSEATTIHHLRSAAAQVGFRQGDLMVEPLPYSGVFGYVAGMAALFGGAGVLIQPAFEPDALLHAWTRLGGTHYVGGDDMLARVREAWQESPADLRTWRWTGIADFQGMSERIAAWSASEFGTSTVGVYGSSEVFALTSFWTPATEDGPRTGGGRLVAEDYAYRIVDPATDGPLPAGARGELQLQGPNVVTSYLGDAGEGAKAFSEDGWFRTGDLAEAVDERTFAYICRIGDVLRLRGFMVDPAEIEMHLTDHPEVAVAKVVGRPDARGETEAVAFVVTTPGSAVTGEELRAHIRADLARYKVPAEVRIIEAMPTTAGTNGQKIRAAALRDWASSPAS